ncbi:MAG: alpha/beta hydrolase [Ferruginibacter sp.]
MKLKNLFPVAILFLLLSVSCNKSDTFITPTPTPVAETITMNVAYGTDPLQKMDIYLPANRSTATTKVLIMIHGGGWTGGDKADFTVFVDTLKKRMPDYAILNINYRLASFPANNPFPTQELDVKAAVEFIHANRSTYLISNKFVLMGASAGGHLSLLHAYKYQTPTKIKAVIDFFGPTDMVAMYNDYAINPPLQFGIATLMSGTPATNPTMYQQTSPLTFATTAAACPTIILQGSTDPTVNETTQSLALKNKLTTASVINQYVGYPGGHGNWDAATYTDAFNKIQAFLAANVQ